MRKVAQARAMTEVAHRVDVEEKTIFRSFSAAGNLTLETVNKT